MGLTPPGADYHEVQEFCVRHLPLDIELYNDFHAQLVRLGNQHCRPRPRCEDCPVNSLCSAFNVAP